MRRKLLKQINFNPVTMEYTFKLLFANESIIEDSLNDDGKIFKTEFYETKINENELKDGTRKRWFQLLGRVLQYQNVFKTKLTEFSEDMKLAYFGYFEKVNEHGEVIILPPSLTFMSDEKIKLANDKTLSFYSNLGVDFKDIV